MSSKIVFAFGVIAIFVQTISAACINSVQDINTANSLTNGPCISNDYGLTSNGYNLAGNAFSIGNNLFGNGMINYGGLSAVSGGYFPVSSASPIYPSGISLLSENAIDGCLDVSGQLPFLGTVGVDGQLSGGGSAATQYSCGSGNVGILSEGINGFGFASGAPFNGATFTGAPLTGTQVIGYDATGCGVSPIVNSCGNVIY